MMTAAYAIEESPYAVVTISSGTEYKAGAWLYNIALDIFRYITVQSVGRGLYFDGKFLVNINQYISAFSSDGGYDWKFIFGPTMSGTYYNRSGTLWKYGVVPSNVYLSVRCAIEQMTVKAIINRDGDVVMYPPISGQVNAEPLYVECGRKPKAVLINNQGYNNVYLGVSAGTDQDTSNYQFSNQTSSSSDSANIIHVTETGFMTTANTATTTYLIV
jgi:hypothetical protein